MSHAHGKLFSLLLTSGILSGSLDLSMWIMVLICVLFPSPASSDPRLPWDIRQTIRREHALITSASTKMSIILWSSLVFSQWAIVAFAKPADFSEASKCSASPSAPGLFTMLCWTELAHASYTSFDHEELYICHCEETTALHGYNSGVLVLAFHQSSVF